MSWFSDFVDSVKEAFSGGSNSSSSQSDSGSGNDRKPPSALTRTRPQPRPSILTVQRKPEDERQMVATRDMPRYEISEGQSESEPEYSSSSLRGLTSTDSGNVMRNIQGAERQARATPADSSDRDESPTLAQAQEPVQEEEKKVEPVQEEEKKEEEEEVTESGMTVKEEAKIEKAGEKAAAKARRLGLASTIATSPGGLLAGGQGTTRRRRSLIGGGLIS
jgi:hypothetical protein